MDFVAMDFEWISNEHNSICEVGYTIVKNNNIVGEPKNWLIKPPQYPNFGNSVPALKSRIKPEMVRNEPTFDEIWPSLSSTLNGHLIVTHNVNADLTKLKGTLDHYGIEYPDLKFFCSLNASEKMKMSNWLVPNCRLTTLCNYFGIIPGNHRAGEDSRACAELTLKIFKENQINKIEEIEPKFGHFFRLIKVRSQISKPTNSTKILKGKCFVVSGVFENYGREEILQVIVSNGGKVRTGVTGKTDYLVKGINAGHSKLEMAQKLNIKIISEGEFIKLLKEE